MTVKICLLIEEGELISFYGGAKDEKAGYNGIYSRFLQIITTGQTIQN